MPPVSHFDVMEGGLGRNPLHRVETRDEGVAVGRDALRLAFRRDRGVWLEIPSVALKRETGDWVGRDAPVSLFDVMEGGLGRKSPPSRRNARRRVVVGHVALERSGGAGVVKNQVKKPSGVSKRKGRDAPRHLFRSRPCLLQVQGVVSRSKDKKNR